jgi:lipid A biosynthesis lauroyl/palmitoleoyl acyltransferase
MAANMRNEGLSGAPVSPPDDPAYHRPVFRRAFFGPRYWTTWLGLGVLRLLVILPRWVSAALGVALGDVFYLVNSKRRHVAQVNIDLCFPELAPAQRKDLVRRHFRVYAQSLLDTGLLWWARPSFLDRYIRIRGLEHYQAACAAGRPTILLSAHFVALDIGGVISSRHYPTVGLIKRVKNELLNWFLTRGRTRFMGRLYVRDQGLRAVIRALKRGMAFYYLPDEDFGPEHSVFLPFFATEAATITALPRLARLARAAVLPCSMRRVSAKDGYEIVLEAPLTDFPSGDDVADARRMNEVIERGIRAAPEQYMWTLKIFRTRRDSAKSPYD